MASLLFLCPACLSLSLCLSPPFSVAFLGLPAPPLSVTPTQFLSLFPSIWHSEFLVTDEQILPITLCCVFASPCSSRLQQKPGSHLRFSLPRGSLLHPATDPWCDFHSQVYEMMLLLLGDLLVLFLHPPHASFLLLSADHPVSPPQGMFNPKGALPLLSKSSHHPGDFHAL